MSKTASTQQPLLVPVYVWDLPVRVTHWLIALSIAVLAVTGVYIGHPFLVAPGPAGQRFIMGTVKLIHFYAAIVFSLAELTRIAWMFMGNRYARWDQLLPIEKERRKELKRWLKFYLLARSETPSFVGHNPLAGLSYLAVYICCLLSALTGYALFAIGAELGSPIRPFAILLPLFGGAQTTRWLHHLLLWPLMWFIVHHIYCAVLVARVSRNATIDSMFTGFRYVEPRILADPTTAVQGSRPGPSSST